VCVLSTKSAVLLVDSNNHRTEENTMFNREAAAQLTEALAHVPDGNGRPLGEAMASLVVERTGSVLRETGTSQAEADEIAKSWLSRIREASITENPRAAASKATKEAVRAWFNSRWDRGHELSIVERNQLGFAAYNYERSIDLTFDDNTWH